jgi:membrane protein YqaA with SNARE-associated domain
VPVADRWSERTLLTLFLIPVTILGVAGIVANAILPTLIAEAPALVPALTTRADRLILVAPLLPGEVFLSIALARELVGDPLFYLFGRRYGEVGIRWIEDRSGPESRWLRTVERLFRRAAYVVVLVWPINMVCLLAGATKMRPLPFFALNITGTIVRIGLIFMIGDLLEDPIRSIVSFITRYQWYLTGISFTLVALSLARQGLRGRGPVQTVDELEDELAVAEAEVAAEVAAELAAGLAAGREDGATVRDRP